MRIVVFCLDDLGRDTALCFHAQGKWRDIQQQHCFDVPGQNTAPCIAAPAETTSSGLTPIFGRARGEFSVAE